MSPNSFDRKNQGLVGATPALTETPVSSGTTGRSLP